MEEQGAHQQTTATEHSAERTISLSRSKAIAEARPINIEACRLTSSDRKYSRKLAHIPDITAMTPECSKIGEHLLRVWELGRMTPTILIDIELGDTFCLPDFSSFCANISRHFKASEIGYLPLIPSSPTNPGVVKTAMKNLV